MTNLFEKKSKKEMQEYKNFIDEHKYRKSAHFKKWLTLIGIFFLALMVFSQLIPTSDSNPVNMFSYPFLIAFLGIIIAFDHLVTGYLSFRKR